MDYRIEELKKDLDALNSDMFKSVLHDILRNPHLTECIYRDSEATTFDEQAFNLMRFAIEMCNQIEGAKSYWSEIIHKEERNIDTDGLNEA